MAEMTFFPPIVKEFIKALGKGYTYNIGRNGYFIFGILWGIPVPIVTIGIALYYRNLAFSADSIISVIASNPVHIFFLMHPALFGVVFGAMGTVRRDKERERQRFEKSLIEINKKLKNTNRRLRELDGLKDNFLSMVSHELWSPLTTVQGYITFIEEGKAGPLTERQREILKITETGVDHLDYLIGELVDLSKIETGKFEVKLGCVDMTDVVERVVGSLRRRADEKKIILKNEVSRPIPYIVADEKRITQVLTNLLGNAIKFTPEHGLVYISDREKDETVEFAVVDRGIGIPKSKFDRIFDRFYQVDSTAKRKYGGCGLGLAITKNIIELHGGCIWVESEVGKGSKFFFELEKYKEKERKGK